MNSERNSSFRHWFKSVACVLTFFTLFHWLFLIENWRELPSWH